MWLKRRREMAKAKAKVFLSGTQNSDQDAFNRTAEIAMFK